MKAHKGSDEPCFYFLTIFGRLARGPAQPGQPEQREESESRPTADRHRRIRGQSFAEFGLILPLLLGMAGATLDFARLFQAYITLESATRDAAEYAATKDVTATDASGTAQRIVCRQTAGLPGFQAGAVPNSCAAPNVSVLSYDLRSTGAGATAKYPVATVTVRSTLPFRTFFNYPMLTQNGVWSLSSTRTYSVVQNR